VGPLQLSVDPFLAKFFLPGWSKVVKFYFAQSKQTKQPFLAKSFIHKSQISNCKRGHRPPAPTPFQTPMDITIGKTSVWRRQNYFGTLKQQAVEMLIAKLCNVLHRKWFSAVVCKSMKLFRCLKNSNITNFHFNSFVG